MASPICYFIGCDRASKSGRYCPAHEKQLQRRGSVEALTELGASTAAHVRPCRRCGGRDFSIQTCRRPSGERYLSRYCVPCRAKNTARWARENPLAQKLAVHRYIQRNRVELNAKRRKAAS